MIKILHQNEVCYTYTDNFSCQGSLLAYIQRREQWNTWNLWILNTYANGVGRKVFIKEA